jgi:hypothetical protein
VGGPITEKGLLPTHCCRGTARLVSRVHTGHWETYDIKPGGMSGINPQFPWRASGGSAQAACVANHDGNMGHFADAVSSCQPQEQWWRW